MPGLSPYVRTLQPNQVVEINVRGTTVFLRQATSAIKVRTRSNQVGAADGESYELNFEAAEELLAASEFDSIEVTNLSSEANSIEMYIGYGRFRKPVPDIVNVSTTTPASETFSAPVRTALSGVGNANADNILAANSNRVSVTIQADKSNDQIIRVGDSSVDTDQGIQLAAGEAITINSRGAIYVCEETSGTCFVNWIEETVA